MRLQTINQSIVNQSNNRLHDNIIRLDILPINWIQSPWWILEVRKEANYSAVHQRWNTPPPPMKFCINVADDSKSPRNPCTRPIINVDNWSRDNSPRANLTRWRRLSGNFLIEVILHYDAFGCHISIFIRIVLAYCHTNKHIHIISRILLNHNSLVYVF